MQMTWRCLLLVACSLSVGARAEPAADDPSSGSLVKQRPAELRLGLESLKLPGDETMGLLGVAYLVEIAPSWYVGPSAYGAMSGKRGGFFTGGGELACRLPVVSKLELEAGLYVGGGGGSTTLVGSGLMLRPHVDLYWNFGWARLGISASAVRFPDGEIRSNQLGLVLAFDDRFSYTDAQHVGETAKTNARGGVGFDRIAVFAGAYRPRPQVTDNNGAAETGNIGLAGFRAEQAFSEHMRWGIEAAAAAKGAADGYAEVLGTLSAEVEAIPDHLFLGARLGLGLGGGGAVSTGGGGLGKASLYATLPVSRDFYLSLEGGYATAPSGDFRAAFATLQVGMELDHPERGNANASIDGWRWTGSVQHYVSAARRDGSSGGLGLLGFKIDHQIDAGFYLSAQAHSAVAGDAGGFAVGLVGLGWETPARPGTPFVGAELLAGAAGGGGVLTEGGAVAQPMAYAGLSVGGGWRLRTGVGYVHSFRGSLDSPVFDVSLGYAFGAPAR